MFIFETCPYHLWLRPDQKTWPSTAHMLAGLVRHDSGQLSHTLLPLVHAWWIKTWRTIFSSENILFTILQGHILTQEATVDVSRLPSKIWVSSFSQIFGLVNERGA